MVESTVQAWIKADQVGSDRGIVSVGPITGRDDAMGFCLRYDKAGHSGGGTNVILLEQQLTSGRTRIETASDVQRTGAQFLAVTWQQNGNPQIWIDAEANTPSYETSVRSGTRGASASSSSPSRRVRLATEPSERSSQRIS